MLEVRSLTKCYDTFPAVQDLSFHIKKPGVYGLLGLNGAGKTTTLNLITGSVSPTSGEIRIAGIDLLKEPAKAKGHIGYLPEDPPLYPDMTAYEFLSFVAEAKGLKTLTAMREVENRMRETGIRSVENRLLSSLSKGYRQRVGLAQALIGDPDLLILDEPTSGLDPKEAIEIRTLIKAFGSKKTVLLSGHVLSEISAVSDHILILANGKLAAFDRADALTERMNRSPSITLIAHGSEARVQAVLERLPSLLSFTIKPAPGLPGCTHATVKTPKGLFPTEAIFSAFASSSIPLIELHTERLTLEQIFLRLTSESETDRS